MVKCTLALNFANKPENKFYCLEKGNVELPFYPRAGDSIHIRSDLMLCAVVEESSYFLESSKCVVSFRDISLDWADSEKCMKGLIARGWILAEV